MKSLEDLLALNVTRDHQALVCISLPPNIHSSGYWRNSKADDELPFSASHPLSVKKLSSATLSVLEEQMALAFFLTQFLHLALRCFGIPVFVTQMLVISRRIIILHSRLIIYSLSLFLSISNFLITLS